MTRPVLNTVEEFNAYVAEIESRPGYVRPMAFGIGIANCDTKGNFLDTYFPVLNYRANFGTAAIINEVLGISYVYHGHEVIDRSALQKMLDMFAPFANDGKSHANIDLISMLSRLSTHCYDNNLVVVFMINLSPG